jgi:hypothetical protein
MHIHRGVKETYIVIMLPSFPRLFISRSRLVITSIAAMNVSDMIAMPKKDQISASPYTTAWNHSCCKLLQAVALKLRI